MKISEFQLDVLQKLCQTGDVMTHFKFPGIAAEFVSEAIGGLVQSGLAKGDNIDLARGGPGWAAAQITPAGLKMLRDHGRI